MERSDIIHFLKKCLAYEGNGTFGRKIDLPVPLCPVGARQKKHTHNTKHTQKQTNAQQQQKIKANTQTKNKKQNNNDEKEKAGKQRACVSRPPATQLASQPNQPATQTPNAEPVREIV